MFIIFDKEKIKSYIILLGTILVLFGLAFNIKNSESIQTNGNTATNIMINKECTNEKINIVKINGIINKQN